MSPDPVQLRSVALVRLPRQDWHALEPVLELLHERGFPFGTPVHEDDWWRCECGPLALTFAEAGGCWTVSLPVKEDNVVTRALLKTLDEGLRRLPGAQGVEWYKREDRTGAAALSPISP